MPPRRAHGERQQASVPDGAISTALVSGKGLLLVRLRVDGWIAVAGVVALGAAAMLAQAPQPPAGSRFRTGVDVVLVEATVLDRDGAVFPGLGSADFSVEINGRPREVVAADLVRHENAGADTTATSPEITSNQQAVAGRTILIVVDHISLRTESRAVLDTAKQWVATLGSTDRVGLLALPQPGLNIEFTTDHVRVMEGLARITPLATPPPPFSRHNVSPWEAVRMWEGDAFVRDEVVTRECDAESLCSSEIDMLVRSLKMDMESSVVPVIRSLRALMEGMRVLPGPKHVLLLSSGWLMSEREAATELATVARDAALSNVTIHTFTTEPSSPLASRSKPPPVRIGPHRDLAMTNVEMLSGMTGGRGVRLVGKADLAFASLTAGLGGYYRLGVRAWPEDLDGKARTISVRVLRPGAKLAGNRRILAASVTATEKALASGDPRVALRAALESPTPVLDVDVRATSYVLHVAADSRDIRVVVVGDVGRAATGKATAVAALYDLAGKPVNAMENVVEVPASSSGPFSIELTAKPGLYVLRVAVRDAAGRVGSLERPIDARWKKIGGVETPGLVLFRSALGARTPSGLVFDQVTTREQVIAQVALSGPLADPATPIVFEITKPGSPMPAARRTARIAQTTGGTTVARDALPAVTLAPGRYTWSVKIGTGPALLTRDFIVVAPAP